MEETWEREIRKETNGDWRAIKENE
jgi:hypothetical protein